MARSAPSKVTSRVLGQVRLRRLGELLGWLDVWLVHGRAVRDRLDIDFTTGGNAGRYAYVPEGELWIEASQSPADVAATIVHETIELYAMIDGARYVPAHELANKAEVRLRRRMVREGAPRTRHAAVEVARRFLAGPALPRLLAKTSKPR